MAEAHGASTRRELPLGTTLRSRRTRGGTYHPRVRNPSISLQFQHPGDINADPPGRYRPGGCGNLNPTGLLLIGWGSWSQRAARVPPRANAEVPPHPGRVNSHPLIRNPDISLQLQQPGDGNLDPPGSIPPRRVWKPRSHWVIADYLRLMDPARGQSFPSGQRRGPAAPGEDKFPSPGQEIFYESTTPTKTQISRVDTAPQGMKTPTPLGDC